MGLDINLKGPEQEVACVCTCGHQHTKRFRQTIFDANITHNLIEMAKQAGLYEYLWRPEETEVRNAKQLIAPLERGLERLKADPERFKQFNPSNGWGDYNGLVKFVEEYLAACRTHPEAEIEVSR